MMREIGAATNSRMRKTVPNVGNENSELTVVPAVATKTTQNASSSQSVQARPNE